MKSILVTGADGFIGSHLCEKLVTTGYKVKAFVFYNSFNSWGWLDNLAPQVLNSIEVVSGDVRDPYFVRSAVKGCDVVAHLAALIAIPFSYEAPDSYVSTNVVGTLNLLNASKEFGIDKFLHTSTSEVYGTARFVPITEDHPLQGQSPYSASKIAADQLAYSFYSSFNLPVTTIRPFNTYGPRQSARAVIPTIISQICSGKKEIILGSLSPTRDFNFVEDTVSGFMAALSSSRGLGEVVNIGSNYEISIGETVSLIADIMSADVEIKSEDSRIRPSGSEVERLWADNSKALDLFGWTPKYAGKSGLRSGLELTIDWFKNPNNLKLYKSNLYNK